MYEVWIRDNFSAAHHLRNYCGKCESIHGHNWTVEVLITCQELDKIGLAIDFVEAKQMLSEVLTQLDHKDLNTLPFFRKKNPSSENIAYLIYHKLKDKINTSGIKLSKVVVKENLNSGVGYWED